MFLKVFKLDYNQREIIQPAIKLNQPIILSDIYNLIGSVQGVQSVIDVDIVNLAGGNYSPNFPSNTPDTS